MSELFLEPEELRALDAQYERFPPFAHWMRFSPSSDWEGWKGRVEHVRSDTGQDGFERAARVAMRAAALDSGAIEGLYPTDRGFTISVATQEEDWAEQLSQKGTNALALFDAQLKAYEHVKEVAKSLQWLSEAWVRELHLELCEPQETYVVQTPQGPQQRPLPKGEYKREPNHVRTADSKLHPYAPVGDVAIEMARFIDELRAYDFLEAHPVAQAAYAHYALVHIHPFADGNGRVARALASLFYYRSFDLPYLVFQEEKEPYFDALEAADGGEYKPFMSFSMMRGVDAMKVAIEEMKTSAVEPITSVVEGLRRVLLTRGGLTHRELEALAESVLSAFNQDAAEIVGKLQLPQGASLSGLGTQWGDPNVEGLRILRERPQASSDLSAWEFRVGEPAPLSHQRGVQVLISTEEDSSTAIALLQRGPEPGSISWNDVLAFAIEDLIPQINAASRMRLRAFTKRFFSQSIESLIEPTRATLESRGYRRPED